MGRCTCPGTQQRGEQVRHLGRELAKLYRERHNDEPQTTVHLSVKAERVANAEPAAVWRRSEWRCCHAQDLRAP